MDGHFGGFCMRLAIKAAIMPMHGNEFYEFQEKGTVSIASIIDGSTKSDEPAKY
jgi:hypothetical protein